MIDFIVGMIGTLAQWFVQLAAYIVMMGVGIYVLIAVLEKWTKGEE